MNIFYLHPNPRVCAEYHCDSHVVKMILEYAQLLSTAHHLLSDKPHPDLYKKTHVNHPCGVWVRKSSQHYQWLYKLFVECCDEYTRRYGKVHKTERVLREILSILPDHIKDLGFVDPPQCMPEQYRTKNVVEAYKKYYLGEKYSFAKWKSTATPEWWTYPK